MIKAGSNLENRPFDVRCTLLHILYSDIVNVPVTDADAFFVIFHQWRLARIYIKINK